MSRIADNLKRVKERLALAAERCGRSADEIFLVAVTKTRTVPEILEAIRAGVDIIGENRVQEALAKYDQLHLPVRWHMVGHLQRNKVKHALEIFELIHSVDSLRLAEEISRRVSDSGKTVDILVQVNTSSEESKFGILPDRAIELVESISSLKGIMIRGLMTIGPLVSNPEEARPCFARLRELKEKIEGLRIPEVRMEVLSMGMTNDFEVAIEEGANMVRIGTAIFGPRG
ncbi:MAG TPA: YggS family pyridoxal phosphate-dependent enzyme [Candidatus Latescibacteria bacterium]|nr:YggS family pyridoxal phosphate-dependent enzyme [Candidatus Latescibacterota bacterium]